MSNDGSTKNEASLDVRAAIEPGIAELDAGVGEDIGIEDLMGQVCREVVLDA